MGNSRNGLGGVNCDLLEVLVHRSGDVLLEGGLRLLNNADVVAIFDKNVVDAFPARAFCPGTVNENNIPNAMIVVVST
jgi:hypothetical protein